MSLWANYFRYEPIKEIFKPDIGLNEPIICSHEPIQHMFFSPGGKTDKPGFPAPKSPENRTSHSLQELKQGLQSAGFLKFLCERAFTHPTSSYVILRLPPSSYGYLYTFS